MQFTKRKRAHEFYADTLNDAIKDGPEARNEAMAQIGLNDLFFMLVHLLNREDVDKDWLFERCIEVQNSPNNYLDLWAREHYKSTIISFALTIQDILKDPEITFGLFSLTRPIAKGFLSQIKAELEDNDLLKYLYPSVLWADPKKEAPRWSLDNGLIVKRETNPKESTIEAWGLVDAMPTSRHYQIRLYDDIIDERHVGNTEIIKKATKAWELSLNLGSTRLLKCYNEINIARYSGTRYHLNDPYREIIKRQSAKVRKYPGTKNGKPDGKPVLWSKNFMARKRRDMGPHTFGCQILQDPTADEVQGFLEDWLLYWTPKDWRKFNRYLLCDPAGEKKKENDYTVMLVIGLGTDSNYYLIDGIRDRLNLTQRASQYIKFHRMYNPIATGYEKYGKDSDIEHIKYVQNEENYRFVITPLGGPTKKNDRIRKLIPIYEQGRFYLPVRLPFIDYEKRQHDLTREFVDEEYLPFPVGDHDDILDCMARIVDPELGAVFPKEKDRRTALGEGRPRQAITDYNVLDRDERQPVYRRRSKTDYDVLGGR